MTIAYDTSAVFHSDMLSKDDSDILTDADMPWAFETEDRLTWFATEDEACAAQRAYRESLGFDPETGEKIER